ncbi:MAG: DNA polymerase III subunit gamma/tau [Hyellaceae cyanobacterium CSU_1_1]|nr:DNA polymerase III subunit gamma/tau [Hyellaceae cyanobacterium CSU_1_1]
MAYEPLHHKYRPQTFGDLVGQETISLTLSNALEQAKIAPAYLFTGPRGTGKTSSARILAKSLNCLNSDRPTPHPCGKCEVCLAIAKGSALDVMEIDAASNTGVDNIREIIERSRFAPVQCRYKIYVVDECHMLSTAAFNALLKTLEEPPPQVVFILATTDPQRVLSTIISRCQRFDYRRIPLREMTAHLRYIADAEKIAIADDALTLVAQIANGGLRDAESLLDQLSLLPETITVEKVWDLVGAVPEQDLLKLLQAINSNDSLAVLQQCRSLLDRGREPLVVLQNLAGFYLNLLIAKTAPQQSELTAVTETCWQQLCLEANNWQTAVILRGQQHLKAAETQLKRTTQPRLWLEVTLLGLLPEVYSAISIQPQAVVQSPAKQIISPLPSIVNTPPTISQNIAPQNTATIAPAIPTEQNHLAPTNPAQSPSPPPPVALQNHHQETAMANPTPVAPSNDRDLVANQEIWSKVVSCLQPPTTQALLKQQCHLVSFDGLSAIVGISSAKLQKLNQGKVPNIEAAFAQVCQRKVRVQLEVASSQGNRKQNAIASINQPVVETPPPAPEQPPNPPPPTRVQITPSTESAAIKPQNQASPAPIVQISSAKSHQQNFQESDYPKGLLKDRSSTIAAPNISALTPPTIATDVPSLVNLEINSEIAEAEDYGDSDLQQAIASLTQSFEGELVQLDNMDDILDESFEDDELPQLVDIATSLERPDIAEYTDEW